MRVCAISLCWKPSRVSRFLFQTANFEEKWSAVIFLFHFEHMGYFKENSAGFASPHSQLNETKCWDFPIRCKFHRAPWQRPQPSSARERWDPPHPPLWILTLQAWVWRRVSPPLSNNKTWQTWEGGMKALPLSRATPVSAQSAQKTFSQLSQSPPEGRQVTAVCTHAFSCWPHLKAGFTHIPIPFSSKQPWLVI